MSSARPSLGKLDAHLSFVPDDDEDEVVSPEPEPERSVADTKAEEKRITDIISEAMDLNMMDMEVKFQQYESAGPLAEEYATDMRPGLSAHCYLRLPCDPNNKPRALKD